MKRNEKFDDKIKMAFLQGSDEIKPSIGLFDKIKKDIYKKECMETMKNKGNNLKKSRRFIVLVASFVMLFSITVIGVTMGKSWLGYTNLKYKTFPSQEKIYNDVGFVPKYTDSLPGGFEYVNGGSGESKLSDETGNILTKTKDLSLGYRRGNEKSMLDLSITQVEEEFLDNKESQLVGHINGINLYYYQQDYKFVPSNYELTEEDKNKMEAGQLEISYGESDIKLSHVQGLSWYEDGLEYMIMGGDFGFTVEEMMDMARVIIQQ